MLCSGQGHRWKKQLPYPLHNITTPVELLRNKQKRVLWMVKYEIAITVRCCCLCIIILQVVAHGTVYCIPYELCVRLFYGMIPSLFTQTFTQQWNFFQRLLKLVVLKLYVAPLILLCCCIEHRHMCMKIECWGNGASHGMKTAANCDRRFSVHTIWLSSCYKWKKNEMWYITIMHNEELHNWYQLLDIIEMINLKRIWCVQHITCMGEWRMHTKFCLRNLKGWQT